MKAVLIALGIAILLAVLIIVVVYGILKSIKAKRARDWQQARAHEAVRQDPPAGPAVRAMEGAQPAAQAATAHHDAHKTPVPWKSIGWLVLVALLFWGLFEGGLIFLGKNHVLSGVASGALFSQPSRLNSPQEGVGTAQAPVKNEQPPGCADFSTARHSCTFGEDGSPPLESHLAGFRFCYDIPYGDTQSYTRMRWDDAKNGWVVWNTTDDSLPAVYRQMFFANHDRGKVTVTYWLSPTEENCPNTDTTTQ